MILFIDIRGFTSFSEDLLLYDVIHILNRHFYILDKIITKYGGYVDNYMGDGLIALFEMNNPQKEVIKAVRASLEIIKAVETEMKPYLKLLWNKSYEIGIGLHYGLVVAGTVGSSNNRQTTVIGDAVNFASRIESANKKIGSNFLISDDVYKLCPIRIMIDRSTSIKIRGKTGNFLLHEVVGIKK
ncbi:MAG: adenylate/guanylate cyclase domain-containing protein [Candidatus Cloacimonetes bacterium]|nr:adenylate/guanylate cyclase domain-containing protein [Candidatus Cloacimonadota bacterium]